MAAPAVADYVSALFQGTNIAVKIEKDIAVLTQEYPLLAGQN